MLAEIEAPCSKSPTRQSRYGDGALQGIFPVRKMSIFISLAGWLKQPYLSRNRIFSLFFRFRRFFSLYLSHCAPRTFKAQSYKISEQLLILMNCRLWASLKKFVAGQEGFEPPTLGFGVRRSAVRATGLHHPTQRFLGEWLKWAKVN